ncbi:MAG: restriction endonuclease subunit S [Terriglobia bacterium]
MTGPWPVAPLGEAAERVERVEAPLPGTVYRQAGVRLWGQGAYEREPLDGSATKYAFLSRLERGDILVNKIWARNGSVAVVPPELAGCYVSSEFPTFVPAPDKLDAKWFHWFTKMPTCWEQCDEKSRGTSGKNRIRPEKFLEIKIPLPPLREQQRVVARIEALAAKIEEARGLRRASLLEAQAVISGAMRNVFATERFETVNLESICADIIDNLHSNPVYAETGVPCVRSPDVGWGVINLDTALRTTAEEYARRTVRGAPKTDDIVLVREGGGTGKAGIVESGQRFSLGQRVMMLRPDVSRVQPRFLLYQILSPAVYRDQILPLSKGSASPHLNIGALRQFRFVLPSLSEQSRIVAHLDELRGKVDALKRLQSDSTAELDAFLPSVLDKAFKGEV